MDRRFAEIAFTPAVKREQKEHGSRHLYERAERSPEAGGRLGPHEQEFIRQRDGFYMATVSESGWPYIQFRGGEKGFLRVLDEGTLGFADLRGNRQYLTLGNLQNEKRVALFLMNYAAQQRLKILGRAEVREGDAEARALIEKLRVPGESTVAERAVLIHVEGYDWNCPQHITPRFSEEELKDALGPIRERLKRLEEENQRLKAALAEAR
jgi:predicted pyridoxine 5'-phosphate oxidase superfamily flavin-nucleotide-binding protein